MTDNVQIENSNGILTLTLARPEKKNALTNEMYGKLADAIEAADNDATVRVILIRGQGYSFTAGNDIAEFAAVAAGAAQGERHVIRFICSRNAETLMKQMEAEGEYFESRLKSAEAREAFQALAERGRRILRKWPNSRTREARKSLSLLLAADKIFPPLSHATIATLLFSAAHLPQCVRRQTSS